MRNAYASPEILKQSNTDNIFPWKCFRKECPSTPTILDQVKSDSNSVSVYSILFKDILEWLNEMQRSTHSIFCLSTPFSWLFYLLINQPSIHTHTHTSRYICQEWVEWGHSRQSKKSAAFWSNLSWTLTFLGSTFLVISVIGASTSKWNMS